MRGFTRRGDRGSPTILFLHGGVINRHMWVPVMGHLDSRYDTIAIDLPGHGDFADRRFTVDDSVRLVAQTLDNTQVGRAVLAGLSLGGYVAQAFTAEHPDRVSGLILSGATVRYTGWDGISTRAYGTLFPLMARPARSAFAKKMSEDLGEAVAGPILGAGLSMKGGAQALRRLPGTDWAKEMIGYGGPIVLANGERDKSNRESEELFREHHPDARSVIIEDSGHACALQQPVAFARVVDELVISTT